MHALTGSELCVQKLPHFHDLKRKKKDKHAYQPTYIYLQDVHFMFARYTYFKNAGHIIITNFVHVHKVDFVFLLSCQS